MSSIIKAVELSNVDFEYILEQLLLLTGLFLLFAGLVELLVMILSPTIYKNKVFQFEMYFICSYMIVFGAFLVMYHNKILVKGYRT